MLGIIENRFELLARLDHGQGETVYSARDRTNGQTVLVRELAPDFFDDPESFEFLQIEFDQAAQLTQRMIVAQLFLMRAADGRVFLVSEYVRGVSLRALADRLRTDEGICPPKVAVDVAVEAAAALHSAHSFVDRKTGDVFPVLHLDVCPTAILLSREGAVKLKGFELSRARLRRGAADRPGRLPYRSPERILGGHLDGRSDQFSLAAVLYELLTGVAAFGGSTDAEIKEQIVRGRRDLTLLDRSATSAGLQQVIERALAPAPENRFRDLHEFTQALSAHGSALKAADGAQELSRLLAGVFNPDALCPPAEQSVAVPEEITAKTMGRGPQADIQLPPRPAVQESLTPTPTPPIKPIEPAPAGKPIPSTGPERRPAAEPVPVSGKPATRPGTGRVLMFIGGLLAIAIIAIAVVRYGGVFKRQKPEGTPIASIPPGAEVFLDGRSLGQTPCTIADWAEGVKTLRLEFEGFLPVETTLVVEEDRPPAFSVFVLGRTLAVSSRPPGAEVLINGAAVSGVQAAAHPLAATDTLTIEVRKAGLASPPSLMLTATGPMGEVDVRRWQIEDRTDQTQVTVTGIFARTIMIGARPPQTMVYLDGDTTAAGTCAQPIDLTFGVHRVMLKYPNFLDYTFDIEVTEDSPERYTLALSRYVRISALGEDTGLEDIGARIEWVRQEDREIKGDGELQTPYSLKLEALEHRIMLARKGYQDTIVVVSGDVDTLAVVMRLEEKKKEKSAGEAETFGWVRFTVKRSEKPVAGATVVAYDKDKRIETELGETNKDGELRAKVRPGKYDFFALHSERRSKTEDAKIKSGQKEKSITLEFR